MGSGEQDVEVGQDGEAEDPDSQKALLNKKERRELKKINAAKEKAHKKFEALLNIGTGTDDGSEKQSPKKRQRTKTAEGASSRSKQTPPKPERKQSEESLLKDEEGEDDEVVGDDGGGSVESSGMKTTRKKKKKKKAATVQHGADNEGFEDNDDGKDIEEDESVATAQIDEDDNEDTAANDGNEGERRQASKIRKKKKKKTEIEMKEYVEKALKKRDDDGLLLCIIIHKADQVKPDARVRHPLIRIHLVDMESGNYIKKTDSTRKVTSMFEKKNAEDDVDYILPLLTQPYDFKTNRTLTPYWDETMVYNEVYSYFLQREIGDPSVIIFFELVDFLQMNVKPKESATTDKGWYRVAWAFLKVISPSGCTNTDRQVRLQFYQPVKRLRVPKDETSSVDIYRWWKYGSRIKYPSTLYVTVKGVYPPDDLQVTNRSMFPTQQVSF